MSSLKKIISMFVLLALSITQVSAVNIPIEHLNVSNDYASVQTAGTDICNLVNTLTESSTLHSDNINWDNVYKIYNHKLYGVLLTHTPEIMLQDEFYMEDVKK